AKVVAFLTDEAQRYVGREALAWACDEECVTQLSFKAEHLSDTSPFDAYLIAPATYHFINSFRHGIAASPSLSVMASALGRMERSGTPILIAPTMHGSMHNSILQESLENLQMRGVQLIAPKDAWGKHNLPDPWVLASELARACSRSPLRGKRCLITAGSIPSWVDDVRVMSNLFRGTLGLQIAQELYWRGAEVECVLGPTSEPPPSFLSVHRVESVETYLETCMTRAQAWRPDFQILSAAVADYEVTEKTAGKIPSQGLESLNLRPTIKVVDRLLETCPFSKIISFKFQLQMSHSELIQLARERLRRGHFAVVANRGEEQTARGEQVAHLVSSPDPTAETLRMETKPGIARALADHLEKSISEGLAKPPSLR
ncbi:MAG: phosphopantothenoylcysteine decarboxylase, partial [Bdellovibrio sp.]